MNLIRVSFTALLALAVGASVPAFAQHDDDGDSHHEKNKDKDKGKHSDKHGREGGGERHYDRDRHEDRERHDDHVRHEVCERHDNGLHKGWEKRDWAHDRHEHQRWAESHHVHYIREEHYVAYFGPVHRFRIVQPVIVAGRPRFQYGGYWFVIGRPLPPGWYYTDEVYVDYMDGGYYMVSPVHPGVRISISIL
ncbi:MAG TPA: hypothetical protein VFL42_10100 [Terriglobales bacterium]|nr:hypothetical protein [Terriglobales bacterium]